MAKIKIKLVRSTIGRPETHKKTIEALGLKKNWPGSGKRRYPPSNQRYDSSSRLHGRSRIIYEEVYQ